METVLGEVLEPIRSLAPGLEYIAGLIDLIGIAIVLWGFVRALVAIRTVISYFLAREVGEVQREG